MADIEKSTVPETEDGKKTAAEKKADKQQKKEEKRAQRAEQKRQELLAYGRKMRKKQEEKRARYGKNGKRRGRFAFAAPLGFIMSILAVIGAVTVVSAGVQAVRNLTDDTALREEAYYFLQPLTTYNPTPEFSDVNEEDLDELLQAAVWRIINTERIRMLREKDDNTAYELDGNGRLIVAVKEVEDAYHYLFGNDAVLHNRSLEDDDLEYSEKNACYYVPFNFTNSLYQPVIDTILYSYPISWTLTALLFIFYYRKKCQQFPDSDE